jgi:hypothetical protein
MKCPHQPPVKFQETGTFLHFKYKVSKASTRPPFISQHDRSSNNNNNNQAFYSQANWGRLEMKPHKNRYKTRAKKKGKTKDDKKTK